jgi:hypothetical protein
MADNDTAGKFFAKYGIEDLPHFSSPDQKLYKAFGLKRGGFSEMFGLKNFRRGLEAISHGVGIPVGDTLQMPGTFLIHKGEVLDSFINETASDVPNYEEMACGIN